MSATCNVQSAELGLKETFSANFGQLADEIKVIRFSETNGNQIRLVNAADPGGSGSFWFKEKERLADGFSFTFNFEVADGGEDGIAFLVQNDRIQDIGGGGGAKLGFSEALSRSLAVAIDTCVERGADNNCVKEELRLEISDANGGITTFGPVDLGGSIKGSNVAARVDYLADTNQVVVFLNNAERLRQNIGAASLEEIFGSKFAFYGFTSSNGGANPATVVAKDLTLTQMNSGFRLDPVAQTPRTVDFGSAVTFQFVLVDSCNIPRTDVEAGFNTSVIQATLRTNNIGNTQVIEPQIIQNGANPAFFSLNFAMPSNIQALWDLNVEIGGVVAQQNPVRDIVDTVIPDNAGLQPLGIGLLSGLIAVLVIAVIYMVNRLDKYRKKLNEHAEDIGFGKTKQIIDKIDENIDYTINPMVAPLDKLQERLDQNKKTIEELKAGQREAEDSDFVVEQLQAENEKLRLEMNDLKKKQEMAAAGSRISTAFGRRLFGRGAGPTTRKDFDQERA